MDRSNRRWTAGVAERALVVTGMSLGLGLGLGADPAVADDLHLPAQVCLGETVELTWDPSSVPGSYHFGGIFLAPTEVSPYWITDSLCTSAMGQCDENTVDSYDWDVSWALEPGDYQIRVGYYPPTAAGWGTPTINFFSDVEVRNCELVNPGTALQAEVEDLELQQWQEYVMGNQPPGSPFPQCWSCGFKVDLVDTFLALDRSGIEQDVSMHVLDSRGQVVADYGTFSPGRRGYSDLPPEVAVTSTSRLSSGRNCGLQFEITDAGGLPFASAPICVEIGR